MNTSTTVPRSSVSILGKSFLSLAALLACAPLSHATLLLQENFNNLTAGDLNTQNGWTADATLDVANGGLSYTNGSITIDGGSKHAVWSGANAQPTGSKTFATQSGDVWFSLTINISAADTASRFWFYVSDDADLGNAGVFGKINNNSNALLAGYRATTSQFTSSGTSLVVDTTLFIVGRFSQTGSTPTVGDYDRMQVWINPDSTTLSAVADFTAADSVTGSGISSGINTFAVTALGTGSTVLWDNLLVGTTQADVLNVYAIPEPSTYAALGGLTALGLAALRRRRS
jgi:hypothetical protein